MLLIVVVAFAVLIAVSLPNLRSGSRILTPGGGRVVGRAKEHARRTPVAAVGSTWQGLVRLRARTARSWAPISAVLHEGLDRLEGRSPSSPVVAGEQGSAPAAHPAPAAPAVQVAAAPVSVAPVSAAAEQVSSATAERVSPAADQRVSSVAPSLTVAEARWPVSDRFDVEAVIGRRGINRPRSMPFDSGPIPQVTHRPTIDLRGGRPDDGPDTEVDPDADSRERAEGTRRAG